MRRGLTRSFITIAILSASATFCGFVRNVMLLRKVGVGVTSDSFFAATTLIDFIIMVTGLLSLLSVATSTFSMPGIDKPKYYTSFMSLLVCYALCFALIGIAFPGLFVSLAFHGMAAEGRAATQLLVRILAVNVVFVAGFKVLNSILGVEKMFVRQNIPLVIINLLGCAVVSLASLDRLVTALSISLPCSYGAAFICQIVMLMRRGYTFAVPGWRRMLAEWKKIILLSLPLMLSNGAESLSYIVDKSIASYFSAGVITALTTAQSLTFFAVRIILFPLMRVIFPEFSRLYHCGQRHELKKVYYHAMEYIAVVFIPISIFIFMHNEALVRGIFAGSKCTAEDAATVAHLQYYYSVALVFNVFSMVPNFLLQGAQRNKAAGLTGLVGFLANIIFSILFSFLFGYIGIPLGTTASFLISGILMVVMVKKTIGFLISPQVLFTSLIILALGLFSAWISTMINIGAVPLFAAERFEYMPALAGKMTFFPLCWALCFIIFKVFYKRNIFSLSY